MTEIVKRMLEVLKSKEYRSLRVLDEERPIVYPLDYFGFHFGKNEEQLHRLNDSGNVTPNYTRMMNKGFLQVQRELEERIAAERDEQKKAFGQQMLEGLVYCIEQSRFQQKQAAEMGHERLADALTRVPFESPRSFYEACLFVHLCIYFLRSFGAIHIGLGRFDQYMYPYFERDLARGVSEEELFEILEAFFISLNYDADLYRGIQQGDNGQSMVLGGFDKNGSSVYNKLSEMCMKASLELNLIDPKINLRVGKNTPDELYEFGTQLTKQG
ncbi:MAG: pyruvate formate-lyase, partial [Clostridia bacterium]|nr:pyruvate formate-lyase [Clostridia bacterium]